MNATICLAGGLALLGVLGAARGVEPLVTAVVEERSADYHGDPLRNGTPAYTDRAFPLEEVPEALAGAVYLRFPNDYKEAREGGAAFTLARPATVYLGLTGEAPEEPAWVKTQGFAPTDFRLTVGAAASFQLRLVVREFPAGAVTLGPNRTDEHADGNMYGVIVKERAPAAADAPPLVSDVAWHHGPAFHGFRAEERARVYSDRDFFLKALPKDLEGAVLIPTPVGLRTAAATRITLTLSASATLTLGFEGPPPAWVKALGLTRAGQALVVGGLSRSPDITMDLYRGPAGPGRVVLGPNADAARTPGAMYAVLVKGTAEQNAAGVRSGLVKERPKPIKPDNPQTVWCDDADRWTAAVWAGNPTLGPGFEQGPLLEVTAPGGLLFGPDGMVYAVAGSMIAIIKDGRIVPFAGVAGVTGHHDGPAQEALFGDIGGIAFAGHDDLIVFDKGNLCFRRITVEPAKETVVTTLAGVPGKQGYQDGPASEALFRNPWSMAVDSQGRIYTFDNDNLRRIADGRVETLNPKGGKGYQDGPLETARFNISPGGGCSMAEGDILYLADRWNHCIRRIDLAKGEVSTVCGAPTQAGLGYHDGPAPIASFHDSPGYVLYDPLRKCLYTNGVDEQCIRRLDGGWLKTLAGLGRTLTGPVKDMAMTWPGLVGVDREGNLYQHDAAHPGIIRKLTFAGGAAPGQALTRVAAERGRLPAAGAGANLRRYPSAAFGGSRFLVVWQEGWTGLDDRSAIVGAFFERGALGQPFMIARGPGATERPAVAADKDGFLVAWQEFRNGRDADIFAARVTAEGKVLDAEGVAVAAGGGTQCRPTVASDGVGYLVAWQSATGNEPYAIRAARVGGDGRIRDTRPLDLGKGCMPAAAFGGGNYLVVWDGGWNQRGTVRGVLVPPEGAPRPAFDGMQVLTNAPSVAAGPKGFIVVASCKPEPNAWGWGGPSGFAAARVEFDGSAPDRGVEYAYYNADLAARKRPNILDSSQWKRNPLRWPAGQPGGFSGTENDQWPYLYSAIAPQGDAFVAVWVRRGLRNRWMLTGAGLFASPVFTDPWRVPAVGGVAVSPPGRNAGHPRLAAGAGQVLLVYEEVQPTGGLAVVAKMLDVK